MVRTLNNLNSLDKVSVKGTIVHQHRAEQYDTSPYITNQTVPSSQNMDKGKLCILLLSALSAGLCGFSSALPRRHFHFIKTLKTWNEALHYCRVKYTEMATVNDEQDLGELACLVYPWHQPVHLGLYLTWSWSLSENDDHKEGEQSYSAWTKGNPGLGRCTSIGPSGGWNTTRCSRSLNFFCYDGYVTDLSKRFVMGNGSLMWPEAQTYCRTHHTDLARIRNHNENLRLQAMAHDRQVWIGMALWRW
ncbi:putative C-type lectin domain family 20 member A, partial [Sphaeramia orbicularis]|uniref:putative C-type lectin domain family 20 member A n=1 Tax=Sphaeramia orbicularis TaxID=375764 RepID=UPI0011809510